MKSKTPLSQKNINNFLRMKASGDLPEYFTQEPPFIKQNFSNNLQRQGLNDLPDHYRSMQELLIEYRDALNGIITRKIKSNLFPTGTAYIRNANRQTPLNKRLNPNHPIFFAINLVLRMVVTARVLDYTLQFYGEKDSLENYTYYRTTLQQTLVERLNTLLYKFENEEYYLLHERKHDTLRGIETAFDDSLVKLLHEARLDLGIEPKTTSFNLFSLILFPFVYLYNFFKNWWSPAYKPYQKLIDCYRLMSSLLDPSPSVVTVLNFKEVMHAEISTPLCGKTQTQQEALTITQEIFPDEKNNFYAKSPLALQLLIHAFSELSKKNDRAFSAQMRHVIPTSLKNCWSVQTIMYGNHATVIGTPFFRSASLVSLNSSETDEQTQAHTDENLQQLHAHLNDSSKRIHFSCLLTNSYLQNQKEIFYGTARAAEKNGDALSYTPVNFEGCLHTPQLASIIDVKDLREITTRHIKADRARYARHVFERARQLPNTVPLVFCASGQDRTGTMITIVNVCEFWEFYNEQHETKITFTDALIIYLGALNPAFIATALNEGAFGMKTVSANDLIDPKIQPFAYLQTANCNKSPPLSNESIYQLPNLAPEKLTAKQWIVDQLHNYLEQRQGLLYGFFLFFSPSVTKTKIDMVKTCIKHLYQTNTEQGYSQAVNTLKQAHQSLIQDENQHRFFTRVSEGELGKRLQLIENRWQPALN